jgi:aspartate carbamoyltransferase catalytic subunit
VSKKLSVKHLLGIKELCLDDIELIFETADTFKELINRPIKKVPSLRDIKILPEQGCRLSWQKKDYRQMC